MWPYMHFTAHLLYIYMYMYVLYKNCAGIIAHNILTLSTTTAQTPHWDWTSQHPLRRWRPHPVHAIISTLHRWKDCEVLMQIESIIHVCKYYSVNITCVSDHVVLWYLPLYLGTGGWGAAWRARRLLPSSSPNSPPSLQGVPQPFAICPFCHCFSSIKFEVGLKGQPEC